MSSVTSPAFSMAYARSKSLAGSAEMDSSAKEALSEFGAAVVVTVTLTVFVFTIAGAVTVAVGPGTVTVAVTVGPATVFVTVWVPPQPTSTVAIRATGRTTR